MSKFTPFDRGNAKLDAGDTLTIVWRITAFRVTTGEAVDVRVLRPIFKVLKKGIATGIIYDDVWTSYPTLAWLDDQKGDAKCQDIDIDQPFADETLELLKTGELELDLEFI